MGERDAADGGSLAMGRLPPRPPPSLQDPSQGEYPAFLDRASFFLLTVQMRFFMFLLLFFSVIHWLDSIAG